MKKILTFLLAAIMIFAAAGIALAESILLSQGRGEEFYGDGIWNSMTNALNIATNNNVTVVLDFEDLDRMLCYDAIWLDQRWLSGSLSALETSNISAFIATGRKVVMIGENGVYWYNWNNQILGLAGGVQSSTINYWGTPTGAGNNALSPYNVYGQITVNSASVAIGGTPLYTTNFATVWGAAQNVLTVLDLTPFEETYQTLPGHVEFVNNIAAWVADSGPATVSDYCINNPLLPMNTLTCTETIQQLPAGDALITSVATTPDAYGDFFENTINYRTLDGTDGVLEMGPLSTDPHIPHPTFVSVDQTPPAQAGSYGMIFTWNLNPDPLTNFLGLDGAVVKDLTATKVECHLTAGIVNGQLSSEVWSTQWVIQANLSEETACIDNDNDGYGNPGSFLCRNGAVADCDDTDINIHPATIWYEDSDGDGSGNSVVSLTQCAQPVSYVLNNTDCDDTDPLITSTTWYQDSDGDTYGNSLASLQQCTQPAGYVLDNTDCNDTDPLVTSTTWYQDSDGDTYGNSLASLQQCTQPTGYVLNSDDCNDVDPLITIASTWHPDADGDGFGDPTISAQMCIAPEGHILDDTDCNDNDVMINPAGPSVRSVGVETVYYILLSEALAEPQRGDIINVRAEAFTGNLIIDTPNSITLAGGYDCGYYGAIGYTTLNGNLTIANGTVTLGGFIIQ